MKKRYLLKVVAPMCLAVALAGTIGAGAAFANSSHSRSHATHSTTKGNHAKAAAAAHHAKTSKSSYKK
jgi:hypothetical protein